MKKYMVENANGELYELLELYPINLIEINQDLEEFKKYVQYFDNKLTKELLVGYIFIDYVKGWGDCNLFGTAAIADYTLEALEVLELKKCISFIEMLYKHYIDGGKSVLVDAWEVFIKLYIGKITVQDVINKEEKQYRGILKNLISKYYAYLEDGLDFSSLYYAMKYDFNLFNLKNAYTNIISNADNLRKEKALYCANHIYIEKHI